jgi:hypothetical protein
MKNCILLTLLIIFAIHIKAQDLIIKTNNDSIPCKINELGALYISYYFNNGGLIKSGNIATQQVKNFQYNVLPADSIFLKHKGRLNNNSGIGFYLSASVGLGYLFAPLPEGSIPDFYKKYLTELRSGTSIHVNAMYFINSRIGFGFHYDNFNTQNRIDKVVVYTTNDTLIGPLSDNINTHYLAPTLYIKFGNTKQSVLPMIALGIGYTNYVNDASLAIPFKIESSTIGLNLQGILDINMGYNLALSLKLGAYSGSLTKASITDINARSKRTVTYTEPDNISRIDIHAGLRYKFGNH